mmetsp:Transcript_15749/g.59942  ORF Transcript_15749/g.59942 Transcript_15749/m.59942 type:complete len:102 (+) Transcript_15749:898-1203(+)
MEPEGSLDYASSDSLFCSSLKPHFAGSSPTPLNQLGCTALPERVHDSKTAAPCRERGFAQKCILARYPSFEGCLDKLIQFTECQHFILCCMRLLQLRKNRV